MPSDYPNIPPAEPDGSEPEFDPYYAWLSIPPAEQPPNHYRLLGVKVFEADREIIAGAADRQAAYVSTAKIGRHSSECEKLLTEIFQAKVCLLDPVRKAEYDRSLQEKVALVIQPNLLKSGKKQGRSRKKKNAVWDATKITLGGMAGTILALLLLVYGFGIYPFGIMGPKDPVRDSGSLPKTGGPKSQRNAKRLTSDLSKKDKSLLAAKPKNDVLPAEKAMLKGDQVVEPPEKLRDNSGWIDFLQLVDPDKHAVHGTWIRKGDEITTEPVIDSRITVPSFLDGSYEVGIEFTRHTGYEAVSVILPVKTTSCVFYLGGWAGRVHGLGFIDGKYPDAWPENHELAKVFKINNGQRYRWDVQVTIDKDSVNIVSQIDQKQLLFWKGRISRLSIPMPTVLPNRNSLGLGAFQGRCTFHRVELRFSDSEGTLLVPDVESKKEKSNE